MTIERHDTWYGWQPVEVKAFKTKRKGVAVTRYRLVAKAGGWYSPNSFVSDFHALRHLIELERRSAQFRINEVAHD